jgi:hypothetical protein
VSQVLVSRTEIVNLHMENTMSYVNELHEIEPRARNTDPATSHEAADAARDLALHHAMLILATLRTYGPMSPTGIARRLGLDRAQIFRRMSELESQGRAYPTGNTIKSPSNRNEREWAAVVVYADQE